MPLLSDSIRNLSSALIVAALIIAGLILGKDLLIPLTLAAVLTFVLSPVVRWLLEHRIQRGLAVALIMIAVLASVVGFAGVVSTQLISLTAGMDGYRSNIVEKVRAVTGRNSTKSDITRAAEAVDAISEAVQKEMTAPGSAPSGSSTNDMTAAKASPPATTTVVVTKPSDESSGLMGLLKQAGGPMGQAALTLLLTAFLLAQYQDLRDRVVRVVGTDHMSETTAAMSEAGERLSNLFLTQALLNGGFGMVVGVLLWSIGLPNAILWGLVTAVMRFVPYIGSFLAALPPILLAAAIDPGWGMFFATAAVFLIGEPIMGHVVEPLVLGKRAGISPFAMVASAGFWTLVWGPVGLILAAPLTMTLIVLGRYVTGLEFFSVLLGDEPALSPPHELYHRLLSDDAAAAAHHVDDLLSSSSIEDVTDRLIFPALSLAAQDMRTGRLEKEQIAQLSETSADLLDLLAEDRHADRPSEPDEDTISEEENRILIIPVRGAVDAIAARYLSHILKDSDAASDVSISASSGLTGLSDASVLSARERPNAVILATVSSVDSHQMRFVVKRAVREFGRERVAIIDYRSELPPHMATSSLDVAENVAYSRLPSAIVSLVRMAGKNARTERGPQLNDDRKPETVPA